MFIIWRFVIICVTFSGVFARCRLKPLYSSLITPQTCAVTNTKEIRCISKGENWNDGCALCRNGNRGPNDSCAAAAPKCNHKSKFRTLDGSCNNLENPTWGMVGTAYSRLLPPIYDDGIGIPRFSFDGSRLPHSRVLSNLLFPEENVPDPKITLLTMQWGQIIAHDSMISLSKSSASCCQKPDSANPDLCLSIKIPKDDAFYSQFGVTCIPVRRVQSAKTSTDCSSGPDHQINFDTHYLDMSQVYGSTTSVSNGLRTQFGGLLESVIINNQEFLPQQSSNNCFNSQYCPRAGDIRVGQNPQLAILQTILLREHNRIVKQLEKMHPTWNDEKLFQEGRALNIAQYQRITYTEWLPLLFGSKYMESHSNLLDETGNCAYQKNIKANTINEFTAAAYRSLHSQIQGTLLLFNANQNTGSIALDDFYDSPGIITTGKVFDELLMGLTIQQSQLADKNFEHTIKELLLRHGKPFGSDLESIDIERGRDNGLQPYIQWLNFCSNIKISSFSELLQVMNQNEIAKLEQVYRNVEDIELFIGGVLERPKDDAIVGPTFLCLLGEQFFRYKYGDRFFYTSLGQPGSLTEEQLKQIKNASLARLICDNSNINVIPLKPFELVTPSNPLVSCSQIPKLDLNAWN